MFDFSFNWDNSLLLGIETIDKQHQELFKIGRHIEQLLLIQCIGVTSKELMSILYEIREYATYHFYEEEQFMRSINYPLYEEHCILHQNFKAYINGIDYSKLCDEPYPMLKDIRDYLVRWIFDHLVHEDKQIQLYYDKLNKS